MNIIARIKGILLSPVQEWGVIDTESASVSSLYTKYAALLALIPAVASFIGTSLIGITVMEITVRTPIVTGLVVAVISYALALAMLYVLALIANALAPQFGGQPNVVQALKVAVYSATPQWVVSIVLILPKLSLIAALVGIYGLVLMWLGLPRLMKVPDEKKVAYNIIFIICAIVAFIVIGFIVGVATSMLAPNPAA